MQRKIIQVQDKVPLSLWAPLSLQHMFAMFGASVLVPILFKADPAVILLMNGVATLLFILITKGKAPAYLGSSFAFIAPVFVVLANPDLGYRAALGGFVAVGVVGMLVALLIWKFGIKWIDILLPAAAMGPVVALIGLELAGVAASNNAHLIATPDAPVLAANVWVFIITLGFAVFGSVLFKKFFSVIPILIAIIAGYIAALCFGIVDFSGVQAAAKNGWLSLPKFQTPVFNWGAIGTILPAILVIITEHIGHQLVTSKIVEKDLLKDPGLHRSLFADFFSTSLSGLVGSVPTTTYGENIGVMAVTKVYAVRVLGGAAVISMLIAFIGPVSALIQSIPGPVIGGISFLLYGMIAASGIRIMVDAKVDFSKSRNLALTAVVFITGLSGIAIKLGSMELKGMVLATIVGMVLSLVFFILDKLHLTNDAEEAVAEEK